MLRLRSVALTPTLLLTTALVPACAREAADTSHTPPAFDAPPRTPLGTSIFLEVVDPDGRPIPRARVTLPAPALPDGAVGLLARDTTGHLAQPVRSSAAGIEYRTDAAGTLLIEELEQSILDRLVLRVEADGHAPASVVREQVGSGAHMGARVVLVPVAARELFDVTRGVRLDHRGVRIEIPPGGIVDRNGAPVTGLVELQLAPFASTERPLDHPGPLAATDRDGQGVALETLAMAEVSLWQDGRPLQLAPDARATLELPLPAAWIEHPDPARRPHPGDVIPAWWFDLDAGLWREDGAGTVVANPTRPGALSWIVDVAHFTWWNVDVPWTDHSCLLVTVHKDGVPLAGITIQAFGKTYEGHSTPVVTDAEGQACTAIKLGETATIYVGDKNAPLIPPFDVQGEQEAAACDGNGNACKGLNIDLGPADKDACSPGDSFPCAYTGPVGTEGVGICQPGVNYCGVDMQWKGCVNEQLPEIEDPDSDDDEDCNGDPHNGAAECTELKKIEPCYEGPPGTLGLGLCAAGTRTCEDAGNDLQWSACQGQVLPDFMVDDCNDPDLDSDCDGSPSCGHAQWAWPITGPDAQHLAAVAVAGDGMIYALGRFRGQLTLDQFNLPAPGPETHAFVAKFAPGGNVLAVRSLGPGLGDELELALRGNDQLLVLATQVGEVTVDGCKHGPPTDPDVIVLDLDPALQCKSSAVFGGPGAQLPSGLAVGGDIIHVIGAFAGAFAGLETPLNEDAAFLLALSPALQLQAAERFGTAWGVHEASRPAIAANAAGSAFALVFSGQLALGNQVHTAGPNASTLLVHRDPGGVQQWAAVIADHVVDPRPGFGLALDTAGRVTVAQPHDGGIHLSQWVDGDGASWELDLPALRLVAPELGGNPLAAAADGDLALHATTATNPAQAHVARWTAEGQPIWSHAYGGAAATDGLAVAFTPDMPYPRVVVTGRMRADIVLPLNYPVPFGDPADDVNGFIGKLDP